METQQTAPKEPKKSMMKEILEWVMVFVVALAIALPIRTFVFSPYIVDGNSMNATLSNREIMFTTKYDYLGRDPERFDIVVCRYPNRRENFVKRVVGVPGDTVSVQDGYLYVNGERQEEEYIKHRPNYTMPPYTVGEGEFFVLGDNRSNSNDSHIIGPLQRNQIKAHVRAVVFPFGDMRSVK